MRDTEDKRDLPSVTESLVISEVFGPTVQGEGPHAGQRAAFVRLGGCNLECWWCDTAYTWDAKRFNLREELRRERLAEIEAKVLDTGAARVIITGGEPLLQQRGDYGLVRLVYWLAWRHGLKVDVETNGTIEPDGELVNVVDLFVVSPKLSNAGMPAARTQRAKPLELFAALAARGQAVFKFVCAQPADLGEVEALIERYGIARHTVWLMPEGMDAATLIERGRPLADAAIEAGFNFTTRLHVLAWGNERGR